MRSKVTLEKYDFLFNIILDAVALERCRPTNIGVPIIKIDGLTTVLSL